MCTYVFYAVCRWLHLSHLPLLERETLALGSNAHARHAFPVPEIDGREGGERERARETNTILSDGEGGGAGIPKHPPREMPVLGVNREATTVAASVW